MAVLTNGSTAEHEAEKAVKRNEIGTESIVGVFAIDDLGEVERVNADVGVETKTNIGATDGVAEFLVLVLGVNDDDF